MSTLQQALLTPEQTAALIRSGATLAIAGDETLIAALPRGNWIGGTISYFMGKDGGITSRDKLFVTPIPAHPGCTPVIREYDSASLSQICMDAPANGFSLIVLPAFSDVHVEYAQHASTYEDMFMKPIVGWVAGIHLDDMGTLVPKVRDGRNASMLDNHAVVLHVSLPEQFSAEVGIVNLFQPGQGDVIEFSEAGFGASSCLVNGKPTSLARYLKSLQHDQRLPLVADYSGALVNVSLKSVDEANDRVEFYGPVFPRVPYRLATAFTGEYDEAFGKAITGLPTVTNFSCNCILNYLYGELEGKRTAHITGPMTFGEIAYVLLNQTMVHLTLRQH